MKKNTLLTISILSSISLITVMLNKRSTPKKKKTDSDGLIYKIKDINNKKKNFSAKLNNLTSEMPKLNNAINDINQNVSLTEFKITPRIKRIQQRIDNL